MKDLYLCTQPTQSQTLLGKYTLFRIVCFIFLSTAFARQSRTLLFTATDEFGNVVDPNTGKIISVAGGHTPFPLPPWVDQTPAILQWMNRTRTVLSKIVTSLEGDG